ncbi:hypothetical protein C1Y42_10495 [Pantoea sp. ICBG 985]|uniref:DUF2188 domain-containing protein n=1 Tax=Pantoea dispersa TaxID=59814 RepID=A0ABY3A1H9_9GAMM|nr:MULTISPECIES: hypothetical protein [Pantoea]PPC71660.1 hypothetical protein C1Y42_10495 [Pantoea sp. ICBG 985]TQC75812.1 hypothetical protein FK492_07835 [Pantoea dispersa]
MLEPHYFYLCHDPDAGWVLHKKGCYVLEFEEEKRFIGSLYTVHQALTVARIHHPQIACCRDCLLDKGRSKRTPVNKENNLIPSRHFDDDQKK